MELQTIIGRKKGKYIQVFSDDCPICKKHILNVEIGKCGGCKLDVYLIKSKDQLIIEKINKYQIKAHPTTIIDEEIKVEGMPPFLWMCGDEFYEKLKNEYHF